MKRQIIGRYYTKRERRRWYFKPSDFEDGYFKENAEETEEVGNEEEGAVFLGYCRMSAFWRVPNA